MKAQTLSVSIGRDAGIVYDFVSQLENLPKWATAFCLSIRPENGAWVAETPQGPLRIRISGKNNFGILDHYVSPAPGVEIFVPMRVVPNGGGSEVLFTLFRRPEMTEGQYAQDLKWVEQDLNTLKKVMESTKS